VYWISLWEAWQGLVESPESESVREVVKERGLAVADTFHHMYNQLTALRQDLNSQVKAKVEEINSIAQQLADINRQIKAVIYLRAGSQRPDRPQGPAPGPAVAAGGCTE
jgi:flagellar hook-associated protein FlgK